MTNGPMPAAARRPSAEKVRTGTATLSAWYWPHSDTRPVSQSHRHTPAVPWDTPPAIRYESCGAKATDWNSVPGRGKLPTSIGIGSVTSHRRTLPSTPAEAISLPSGENASPPTSPPWAANGAFGRVTGTVVCPVGRVGRDGCSFCRDSMSPAGMGMVSRIEWPGTGTVSRNWLAADPDGAEGAAAPTGTGRAGTVGAGCGTGPLGLARVGG